MEQQVEFQDIKEYYEDRYNDESRSKRKLEDFKLYLDYLGAKTGKNDYLLDIACGKGMLLKNAENFGLTSFGLDISFNALTLAKSYASSSQYIKCSGDSIGFRDNSFDYISCLGSLEHFTDIPKALAEMIRISKENTKLCIMVPNTIHYRLDAKSKWGVKKVEGTKQQEMYEELHTFDEWIEILESNGLTVEKVYRDRYFKKKKNPLKNLLFYLWLKFLPLKYSYQFIFICKAKNHVR